MLSCKETAVLASKACDRRLSWGELLAVRLHLFVCHGCRQFVRQLRFLRTAGRYFDDHDHDVHGEIVLPKAARARVALGIARRN